MQTLTIQATQIDDALTANSEMIRLVPAQFERFGVPDGVTLAVFHALTEVRAGLRALLPDVASGQIAVETEAVDALIAAHAELEASIVDACRMGQDMPEDLAAQLRGVFAAFAEGLRGLRGEDDRVTQNDCLRA